METILDNSYKNFINSIKSEHTKVTYDRALKYFMTFMKIDGDKYYKLLEKAPRLIEEDIRDYIIYLRDVKKLAPASIALRLACVTHYYTMNDLTLNWKKINRFKGEFYDVVEDSPYTLEQIRLLVNKAEPLRDRAIILLLASSGIRVGAIYDSRTKEYLKVGNLEPIDKYQIYQITIYKKSKKSKYITFCSNECRKELDSYLEFRKRCGEKITKDSPLFRRAFNTADPLDAKENIKPLSNHAISWIANRLLNITGIRVSPKLTEGQANSQHTNLMQLHAFRKFFSTTLTDTAKMSNYRVDMLLGHKVGLTSDYNKLTPEDLLEGNDKNLGYASAMEHLIICEENRLRKKVETLQVEKSKIERLEADAAEWREHKPYWDSLKANIDELREMVLGKEASEDARMK